MLWWLTCPLCGIGFWSKWYCTAWRFSNLGLPSKGLTAWLSSYPLTLLPCICIILHQQKSFTSTLYLLTYPFCPVPRWWPQFGPTAPEDLLHFAFRNHGCRRKAWWPSTTGMWVEPWLWAAVRQHISPRQMLCCIFLNSCTPRLFPFRETGQQSLNLLVVQTCWDNTELWKPLKLSIEPSCGSCGQCFYVPSWSHEPRGVYPPVRHYTVFMNMLAMLSNAWLPGTTCTITQLRKLADIFWWMHGQVSSPKTTGKTSVGIVFTRHTTWRNPSSRRVGGAVTASRVTRCMRNCATSCERWMLALWGSAGTWGTDPESSSHIW